MEFEGLDSGSRVFLEPKGTTSPPDQAILIHFICGNPGLIQIYTPFLETLHSRLLKAWPSAPIYISGHSLKGFDMPVPGLGNAPKTELFTLEDQVKDQERLLKEYCKKARRRSGCAKDPKVILMGHSVGTWIMLNIIQQNLQSYDIIGGILLFPTIVDIASSSAGMFASMLTKIKGFSKSMDVLGKLSVQALPIKQVLDQCGFSKDAADITTTFLTTPTGLAQTIYLGKEEMDKIKDDHWTENVWGASAPKLIFFWGGKDEWVSQASRDKLIAIRKNPQMFIDDGNIPHIFCTNKKHSDTVAGECENWVLRILEAKEVVKSGPGKANPSSASKKASNQEVYPKPKNSTGYDSQRSTMSKYHRSRQHPSESSHRPQSSQKENPPSGPSHRQDKPKR